MAKNESSVSKSQGATLSWRDLSVYAMNRSNIICKQLVNNGNVIFDIFHCKIIKIFYLIFISSRDC